MMYSYSESLLDPKNCSSKRVSRACDRCRLKKTKCDGRRCCNRCLADDAICVFSKRKRSSDRPYSSEYVQLLEDQQMKLVEGVQELYRRLRKGEGWLGPKIAEDSQGYPLVQDLLDSLAVLAPSEHKPSKRKAIEAGLKEREEEEKRNRQRHRSIRDQSSSPPLTPPASQTSASESPIADDLQSQPSASYTPSQIHHLLSRSLPVEQDGGNPSQAMQCQVLMPDGTPFWPMPTSFSGSDNQADYSGLIDPFNTPPTTCNWYSNTFMMM